MRRCKQRAAGGAVLACLLGLVLGCRQEVPPLFRRNQPPQTSATILPADSTQGYYRYHVYWRGEDPDGRVVRFLFAITDTISRNEEENWDPGIAEERARGILTTRTDSIFIFNSDRGRQVFNIVAIDDYGRMDPTPFRRFFSVVDNGLPRVVYVDVQSAHPGIPPCEADPCTVATYTNFKVRFTGATRNGRITGYQWRSDAGEGFQPFGGDRLYVRSGRAREFAGLPPDTLGTNSAGDTLWSLHYDPRSQRDTVTVYFQSTRPDNARPNDTPIPAGQFHISVRVRDEANRTSTLSEGLKMVQVNYDPDTRLYRVAACDCPVPPPGCAGRDSVRAGWIVTDNPDHPDSLAKWQLFCEGDTIPIGSKVRFYAKGKDDVRDVAKAPSGRLAEARYSFLFTMEIRDDTGQQIFSNTTMHLSRPDSAATLRLPGGVLWRGAKTGWSVCPFDFAVNAAAVDEQGKDDGTPDAMRFYAGGKPTIDDVRVDSLIIFVPRCRGAICKSDTLPDYGPGTATIVGRFRAAPDSLTGCRPPFCGLNEFVLPYRIAGHDWPRDRARGGAIRAWAYDLTCAGTGCGDPPLSGKGLWVADVARGWDPPGQQVFDSLRVTIPMQAVFSQSGVEARLATEAFGRYMFSVRGRDTRPIGESCELVSNLDGGNLISRPLSELGRTTETVKLPTRWVPLSQMSARASAWAAGSGPLGNRKRLMQ